MLHKVRQRIRKYCYFPVMKIAYKFLKNLIPTKKNLIIFESGLGKQIADSPKAIYNEIVNRKLPYRKIWIYNKKESFSDPNTKVVKRLSVKYYYYLARAKYWVNNQNFPTYIEKPSQTIYVQTWHGTPLKKMLHDNEYFRLNKKEYVKKVSKAIDNWDFLISPSPYASEIFKSAFQYEKEVVEIGYPRNDIFYESNIDNLKREIRRKVGISSPKKVILYAPTFRDEDPGKFILHLNLKRMKEDLGNEYIILLRTHVVINEKIVIDNEIADFAMDVSLYTDVQELMLISDILITDYSSVMFDFVNTNKPVLFFTYDLKEYRDKYRGFYFDFEVEAPGPLLKNTEEIIASVQQLSLIQEIYKEQYEHFKKKFTPLDDGNSANRLVDLLFVGKGSVFSYD